MPVLFRVFRSPRFFNYILFLKEVTISQHSVRLVDRDEYKQFAKGITSLLLEKMIMFIINN